MLLVESLPAKQKEVLEQILAFIQENGYSPSIQQLCDRCGVTSTSTIHHHVSALKKKGFIHWNPQEKRSISVRSDLWDNLSARGKHQPASKEQPRGLVPLLGSIAAGSPLQTVPDYADEINLSEDLCPSDCYALKVRGLSMIEDHIMDGDIVVINPHVTIKDGEVVVALIDGETATLKRLYREKERIRLQPANAEMDPIYVTPESLQIQGRVETIIRKLH